MPAVRMPVQALAQSNQPQQQYVVPPRAAARAGVFSGILAEMLGNDAPPPPVTAPRPDAAAQWLSGNDAQSDGSTRQWLTQRQAQGPAPTAPAASPRAAQGYLAAAPAGGGRIDLHA
ncbi:hypothetical protein YWS52_34420 [Chitiniphilus shinanonensis]